MMPCPTAPPSHHATPCHHGREKRPSSTLPRRCPFLKSRCCLPHPPDGPLNHCDGLPSHRFPSSGDPSPSSPPHLPSPKGAKLSSIHAAARPPITGANEVRPGNVSPAPCFLAKGRRKKRPFARTSKHREKEDVLARTWKHFAFPSGHQLQLKLKSSRADFKRESGKNCKSSLLVPACLLLLTSVADARILSVPRSCDNPSSSEHRALLHRATEPFFMSTEHACSSSQIPDAAWNSSRFLLGGGSEMYRFEVHGFHKPKTCFPWVLSKYTFRHEDLEKYQMWKEDINAHIQDGAGRSKRSCMLVRAARDGFNAEDLFPCLHACQGIPKMQSRHGETPRKLKVDSFARFLPASHCNQGLAKRD